MTKSPYPGSCSLADLNKTRNVSSSQSKYISDLTNTTVINLINTARLWFPPVQDTPLERKLEIDGYWLTYGYEMGVENELWAFVRLTARGRNSPPMGSVSIRFPIWNMERGRYHASRFTKAYLHLGIGYHPYRDYQEVLWVEQLLNRPCDLELVRNLANDLRRTVAGIIAGLEIKHRLDNTLD